jgi:outer membrane protein assembly factor BamB
LPTAILDTNPVVANSVVYVGANNGDLYGLNTATGKMVWKTHLNGPLGSTTPDGENVPQSNAIGEGILAVPVGDTLHIYR